eukprot:6399961-Prymnesium_polylepis.1
MIPPYPLVRVTRGLVSVAVGRLMNGDYSQSGSALALSETLSATSDIDTFGAQVASWILQEGVDVS